MTRATTRPSASAGRGGIDEHRRLIEILRRQDTGRRERGDHPAYRLFRLGEIRALQPDVHQVLDREAFMSDWVLDLNAARGVVVARRPG